jgi:hypothetical protein
MALAHARATAAAGQAVLLHLDECDLHLLPVERSCWMQWPRLQVPTPGTNAPRAVFGALEAVSGQRDRVAHERKLVVGFVACLQRPAVKYPAGTVILALADAPTHTAKPVQRWLAATCGWRSSGCRSMPRMR